MLRDREAIVSKHEGCYAGVLIPGARCAEKSIHRMAAEKRI
jgi:hypothetical protein